jgi:hypothetical protein
MVCKRKRWGGVPSFIKEHQSANLSLKNLLCMEDSKNPDEEMTNRPSIFVYLVFGPGGITVKGTARPMKVSACRGPGTYLGVQDEDSMEKA